MGGRARRMEGFSPLLGLTFLAAGPKVVLVMGEISWITWRQLGVQHKFVPLFPIAGGYRCPEW